MERRVFINFCCREILGGERIINNVDLIVFFGVARK